MKKREVAIEAINRWDDDSMSVLYDEYYAALVSYGLQILHLKEEAEDVVQSVYAKLWESQPSFESTGELRSYLYSSVRNGCINVIRRQKARSGYSAATLDLRDPDKEACDETLKDKFDIEEMYRLLFQEIDKMPPRRREIFLQVAKGRSSREIAELMSISPETVKQQRRQGKLSLRKAVAHWLKVAESLSFLLMLS